LAQISDAALDNAYHYGRSQPGNTFGWQANLKSAAFAKQIIDKGITDVEAISDAIHKGWNVTAQAFVKNPDQFDDSKTMAPEKLQAKIAQRQKLMTQNYAQLPEDEKEKDRVVARAMLQAITGQQGVAEGGYNYHQPDPAWVTINGKRWKWFFNYVSARKAMDTLNAKFRAQDSKNKADWEPADLEDNPEHGIKVGESALSDFRRDNELRQAKHDKIETDRKANAAAGKEPDVKSAVDRLDAQVNAKEGNEYNEYSDEVDMVENNLHTIVRCCKELAKALKPGENLPEWIEEKISMSKQNVVTALDYMLSQHEQGHVYDEDHSTATGGWGQGSMNAAYKSSALAGAGHDDRTMESDDYFNKLKETLEAAVDERSKSQAQWNLMHAVAHNPAFAKKVGVKQSVGKEFSAADAGHNPKSLPKRVVPKKKK
jgi:hypothetical protein